MKCREAKKGGTAKGMKGPMWGGIGGRVTLSLPVKGRDLIGGKRGN